MTPIVQSSAAVTLIGGGEFSHTTLNGVLSLAPILVAADGGAQAALVAGHIPVAVIGDMDSISEDAQASIPADRLHAIAEQDSTDFDKCLRSIAAPLVLGVGFMGGRMDHALATLNVLVRRAGRPVILVGEQDICFHCPPSLSLSVPVGTRISLFPMAEVTARSRGLRWALDGITFQPWGRSGTSNEAEAPEVRIDVSGRGMMVIMSPDRLDEVMKALLAERVD